MRRPQDLSPDRMLLQASVAMADRLERFLRDLDGGEGLLQAARRAVADFVKRFREEGAESVVPPTLERLIRGFGLSFAERDLLLLAGLPEQHEALASLLRALHPRGEPRPTLALATQLLCTTHEERLMLRAVLEEGAARRLQLLRTAPDDAPHPERSLLLMEGLWPALNGHAHWPAGLELRTGPWHREGLEEWLAAAPAQAAIRALADGQQVTVVVFADDPEIALARACVVATEAGVSFAPLAAWAKWSADLERRISVLSVAHGRVPVVRAPAHDGPGAERLAGFAGHPGPVVIAAQVGAVAHAPGRPLLTLTAQKPPPVARARMWRALVPVLAEAANELAARYALEPGAVAEVALDLAHVAQQARRAPTLEDVTTAVRARTRSAVSPSVQLVRPTADWSALILPPDRLGQLREAVARLRHQARVLDEWRFLPERPGARGVRMLFAGPPGTGKTLSAEVLARALGTDLLVVDISRVVSKWIGETEKNLAEVFDAAERTQAVLLFDEADALFGRRTEVSDAHDRYANLETAYLLSRLERFEGLAVLSTNLRQNVDPAFLRRLEFVVDYEEPGVAERLALWRAHLPATAPLSRDVDLHELARLYPIVGGLIRNAAVAAAFLAAAEGTELCRVHFIRAIRREYEKAGRAFPGPPPGLNLEPR